jgi:lysophospholipase L1-like esterase
MKGKISKIKNMEDELVLPVTTVEAIYMEDGITKLSDEMKDVLKYEEFDNESIAAEIPDVIERINGIEKDISEINSSLDNKASKNEVFSMANMGQDIKEAMTGGSVAVVGKNAILEENIVDLQVTRNKVADGIMDIYPFQPRAKFRHNKETAPYSNYESYIRGLIKYIKLYNADITKQYYIQAINRNVNNNYYIAICDSNNVKVCDFNTNSYTERSGLDTIKLISFNNSGVSGIVIVDWSKFKQNTGIYGMDYEETGLQIGVIVDNDGANFKDYSISKEKLTDDSLMTYPFQIRANFKHNGVQYIEGIKASIKDIHLYGAKPSKRYAISSLWRCVGNERKSLIEIVEVLDDDSTVIIGKTEILNYQEPTGIDEFKLVECNNSGINAIVYIDWSKLPLNVGYYGMKYNETGIDIRCCKDIIPDVPIIPETLKTEIPNIILPQKIYATVGKELNIYYESVVDCDNVFNYKIDVGYNGQGARQLEECFRVIPTTVGNYTFTLKLYRYGDLITSKTCTISVVEDKILGDIRGLYIGDSITEGNWYLYELQNMISTFKSVGTRGDWSGLNHEGRGSWATTHYLSSASYAGKTNAFYNPSSNSFDFNFYISNSSIEIPSFVTIALGTNDAGSINADTLVANFNVMINSIKYYDSSMKIGITIAPPPASNQDGWGKHNGVNKNNWTHKKEIFEFAKKIIDVFDNREDEGIYILPIYVNIDPLLDFPYEEVEASFRNKTVIKRGTDNVHPDKAGMYKISDIHYNWIKAIF